MSTPRPDSTPARQPSARPPLSLLAPSVEGPAGDRPRFLSLDDCRVIAQRLTRAAKGGGYTGCLIHSTWTGNVRWARNQISTSGEVRRNWVDSCRTVGGDWRGFGLNSVHTNDVSEAAIIAADRQMERLGRLQGQEVNQLDMLPRFEPEPLPPTLPQLFSEATYQLTADQRAAAAIALAKQAADAGVLSAGYIAVSATSLAFLTSWGIERYYQYTWAQYSVTVRDPKRRGSGWAGMDGHEWSTIDGPALTARALEKCLKSRDPVTIEPGRYTTILEPQAVCDFLVPFVGQLQRRQQNEMTKGYPFFATKGKKACWERSKDDFYYAKLGEKVVDERLTFSADPLDPEIGFPPFEINGEYSTRWADVFHPITWVEHGVLKALSYNNFYAAACLERKTEAMSDGAFRVSVDGPTTSVEEMIAATKRGLLVTRFVNILVINNYSLLSSGFTRDGLWLIENGRISKPVSNLVFTESSLFALNNVEQVGRPQRAYRPPGDSPFGPSDLPQAVIVPPLKVRDFSFTALVNAI